MTFPPTWQEDGLEEVIHQSQWDLLKYTEAINSVNLKKSMVSSWGLVSNNIKGELFLGGMSPCMN